MTHLSIMRPNADAIIFEAFCSCIAFSVFRSSSAERSVSESEVPWSIRWMSRSRTVNFRLFHGRPQRVRRIDWPWKVMGKWVPRRNTQGAVAPDLSGLAEAALQPDTTLNRLRLQEICKILRKLVAPTLG
jgi:hypothetical protein